ncbi:hypothetical protein QQF21_17150 [Lelliottia sp. V89_10]|uniref:hypothetical protein n=1 Tax=Lelliottia wanjuensis TaxID=3050585 RepID=UPI00249DE4C3|nr:MULTISPECIES: hypothetical protein [unclassified Lelliottia]MDI3359760.1 hypothetical protein [Lelliottia sp. V89_13]MDK9548718.1 hypothetical protein [Lelliottia sp. V89_5]MDK9597350.1 hypothetical protein [Lelliottia sp. V89_10]
MTPKQRRAQQTAMETAAAAPRKSWLGRFTPLSGIQSAWIKSLLTVWGDSMRGGTAPRMPKGHACWRTLKGMQWSDAALERFTAALNQAREEGCRGEHALTRAHAILWPAPPVSAIDTAIRDDDVDFVEQAVLRAFTPNDPVYVIGTSYYTTRKKISDLTRDLQQMAPWLTPGEARKRVRWCVEIFRAKVYLSVKNHSE